MDFRHVDKDFRKLALVAQLVLLAFLAAYAANRLLHISRSEPPVESSLMRWEGFGEWALCGGPEVPQAGVGFYNVFSAIDFEPLTPDAMSAVSDRLASKISDGLASGSPYPHCAMVNLSSVPNMKPPFTFTLCSNFRAGRLFLKSNATWNMVWDFGAKRYSALKLTSFIYGKDNGYSTQATQFFSATHLYSAGFDGGPRFCKWQQSGSAAELSSSATSTSFFNVGVEDPLIEVSMEQGFVPQMLDLMSSFGGYISLLTIIFTCMFARQYPESTVVRTFQARTLFGMHAPGEPPGDAESPARHAPEERERETNTHDGVARMTKAPQNETIGFLREEPSARPARGSEQMPQLPAFSALPVGYRPTE
ncbi:unnamed protein product [Symbiodinium natans]|uniref:Uncharacterized protein n=1 Tax=Symbiodinium natans TaxID=878477 RepID=A0A812S5I5_9DINO|nr:unnamed protein product [Symbiodinium natans]